MCESARYIDLPIGGLGPHPLTPVGALTQVPEVARERDPKQGRGTGRRKLWELPQRLHCAIIGTCLNVDELRRLAERAGCLPKRTLSDYEVHVSFVAAAANKNDLSTACQSLLERRYASAIRRFGRARTPEQLEELWDKEVANGQVQGALWAIMTHPKAPAEMRRLAYEDVHMLSHQIGAGLSADLKALAEQREALAQLRRESAAERRRGQKRQAALTERLERAEQRLGRLTGVEEALTLAREQIAELESDQRLQSLEAQVRSLQARLEAQVRAESGARVEAERQRRRADKAERRAADLEERNTEHEESIEALARLLPAIDGDCDGDCELCESPEAMLAGLDLRGRRILCVGGRGSLNVRYRALVRHCNGELIRHDGGLEDSRQRLESLLASADAVLCPADNVSHDAYLRAKRHCKRAAKPCVLMQRSGIGAFVSALSRLAEAGDPDARNAPVQGAGHR